MTKYAIDTNLYVRAFRDERAAAELERFLSRHSPGCYLHSVVLHELLIGAGTPGRAAVIENDIAAPILRRGRVVTPSHRSWRHAGDAVARLAASTRLDLHAVPRSFVNDALIAASCGESGVTLVTENARDFQRLGSVLHFEYVSPWPASDAAV